MKFNLCYLAAAILEVYQLLSIRLSFSTSRIHLSKRTERIAKKASVSNLEKLVHDLGLAQIKFHTIVSILVSKQNIFMFTRNFSELALWFQFIPVINLGVGWCDQSNIPKIFSES